ncbi:Hypothetical predicted protein, partial [Paramuricea clavata]
MAECPEPTEAVQSVAGETLSAIFKYSKDGRDILINISTNGDVQAMVRDVCKTVATLGALYTTYQLLKPLIDSAVTRGLGGERDQEVRDIKPGSLKVLLHCLTDERFLEVLDDYECGRLKDRLQKEFSQSGIEMKDMKVEILNMEEVSKTKKAINIRKNPVDLLLRPTRRQNFPNSTTDPTAQHTQQNPTAQQNPTRPNSTTDPTAQQTQSYA